MKKSIFAAAAVAALAAVVNLTPASAAQYGSPTVSSGQGHWEWQYHYVGHHARYEGYWVWVK